MNFENRRMIKNRVKVLLGFLCILAMFIFLALFISGCYTTRTFGHVDFPLTLLPDEMITENVSKTIEADPTIMVTLQFSSSETLFGGAKVQKSKKDVTFEVRIGNFLFIEATGGRVLEGAEVSGAELVEALGGAVGEGVAAVVGIP